MTVHTKYKFSSLGTKNSSRSWSDIYRAQVDCLLAGNLLCKPLPFAHNPLTSKNKVSSWTSPCLTTSKLKSYNKNQLNVSTSSARVIHRNLSRSTQNLCRVSLVLTPEACKSFFFFLIQILNSMTDFFFFFLIKGFLTFLFQTIVIFTT